jgi:hypothetical protein
MADNNTIVAIMVVGFHHENGNQIEWSYPPNCEFMHDPKTESLRSELVYLAIPDQAHRNERDYVYFRTGKYYAVACFQQVATKDLKEITTDVTRSSVQKSVCVISTKPIYGPIRYILDTVTQAYFGQKSFSDTAILEAVYIQLNERFRAKVLDNETLHLGVNLDQLVRKWGKRVINLVKLMCLEKKVVFYGVPIGETCNTIVALVSLFPKLLRHMSQGNTESLDAEKPAVAKYAFPLQIFEACYFSPYQSLPQIDFLQKQKSYLIGTSNALFSSSNNVLKADVVVDIETATFVCTKPELRKAFTLSTFDRAFIEDVIDKVNNNKNNGWEGSDDWIRAKFGEYIQSALAAVAGSDFGAKPLNDYNALWIDEWKNTLNFQMWKTKVDLSLVKDDPPHHPGMGLQGATLMGQVNRQFNRVGTALAPLTQQIKDKTTAIVSGLKTEKKSDDSSDEEHVHPQDGPEVHEEPHPTEKPAEKPKEKSGGFMNKFKNLSTKMNDYLFSEDKKREGTEKDGTPAKK